MAKSRIAPKEEIPSGNLTQQEQDDLGVGSPKFYDFEKNNLRDPGYVYRWCNIAKASIFRSKKYATVQKSEIDKIKPFYGEWFEDAWHLFRGSNQHMILMRCPKDLFDRRRTYYGLMGRDSIIADKAGLQEFGQQAWKRGDSIKAKDIIIDERLSE